MSKFGFIVVLGAIIVSGCTDQFNPWRERGEFAREQQAANAPIPKLNEDGSLPDLRAKGGAAVQVEMNSDKLYLQYCSSCHGANGKADGPTAQVMAPKPRNFSDKAWQKSVDDARITMVIDKGGASANLSPTMPAWGNQLEAEQIKVLVGKVRAFGK
jgi:mono/diheme cytochrome c family protein